jgi:hypothetical protein
MDKERYTGPILIGIIVTILFTLFLGVKALTNSDLGAAASYAIGFLGIMYTVYSDHIELGSRENKSDVKIDKSTSGIRPESSYSPLDISSEDIKFSQLSPEELAQTIINSPNWHSAGKGEYLSWWRPRLKKLVEREGITTRNLERSILGATILSMSIFMLGLFSMFAVNDEILLFNIASSIYPQTLPQNANFSILALTFTIFSAGLYYFSFKNISYCPVCKHDFALKSHGRYFKPSYQEVEERENGKVRVTRGVHLLKCDDCGKWSVYQDKWEEELSGSWN